MIRIGDRRITLEDFDAIVNKKATVSINETALGKVQACFEFLTDFADDKVIYGINTGFGPMAQYKIEDNKRTDLQYNLIRSHCSGMGNEIDPTHVLSAMICQLNTMLQGKSGIDVSVPELIAKLINDRVTPVVYEHGGVGASGDLVQLAHLALAYIGEGEVRQGDKKIEADQLYKELNIHPLQIKLREGLSLMNGTSIMTGIGMVNLLNAKKLLNWSLLASALLNEIVSAYDDHFSKELNYSKLHPGQRIIADTVREMLADSQLTQNRQNDLYNSEVKESVLKKKVQEYYSLRCIPQIMGPILDCIENTKKTLENEANSVNDNPIVDIESRNVYHGGNFHGDYVALAMDQLKLSITKLTMLSERQLNFLLNHKINELLPPFVNLGELGFNFGVQGAQFTATSTTAENQMLSSSMYVHSIPNNNDNQDVVSMGTNAATATSKVIENAFQVLSIEFMAIVQAVEYLGIKDKLSTTTAKHLNAISEISPSFKTDEVLYVRTQAIKKHLQSTCPVLTLQHHAKSANGSLNGLKSSES